MQYTYPGTHGAVVLVDLSGRLGVGLVRRDLGTAALPTTADCYPPEFLAAVTATVADGALFFSIRVFSRKLSGFCAERGTTRAHPEERGETGGTGGRERAKCEEKTSTRKWKPSSGTIQTLTLVLTLALLGSRNRRTSYHIRLLSARISCRRDSNRCRRGPLSFCATICGLERIQLTVDC